MSRPGRWKAEMMDLQNMFILTKQTSRLVVFYINGMPSRCQQCSWLEVARISAGGIATSRNQTVTHDPPV